MLVLSASALMDLRRELGKLSRHPSHHLGMGFQMVWHQYEKALRVMEWRLVLCT